MAADPNQFSTIIISRAIRAGREAESEWWIGELQRLARVAPGYISAIRLGQTAGVQHLLFRFEDCHAAETWQAGRPFRSHVAAAESYSTSLRQTKVGDNVAFELPSDASASKWKRFVTTWLALLPVLLILSFVVRAALPDAALPLQLLPSSLILTATLQWIILPRLQRYTRFWLLQDSSGQLKT